MSSALPFPPNELMARVSGNSDPTWFDASGMRTVAEWQLALSISKKKLEDFDAILDFGAGCGRAVRHIKPRLRNDQRLFAADIDGEAIGWISKNIPGVETVVLPDDPPSTMEDESVDLILNHSVFTHLPEDLQISWLNELRRILKVGGILLASFHGRRTTKTFLDSVASNGHPDVAEALSSLYETSGFMYQAGRADYEKELPEYYASAFHTIEYVEKVWFPGFKCLAWLPEYALAHQDVVILEKTGSEMSIRPVATLADVKYLDRIKEADFRVEAMRTVLSAVQASTSWRGLDRRKFQSLIAEASRSIPNSGPAAVQHLVLLDEARKVLGSSSIPANGEGSTSNSGASKNAGPDEP
jgi:SAM-dependent methyltransferase